MRIWVCLWAALALGGCAGGFSPDREPIRPQPITQDGRDVHFVYVHGIGCHEPGYSMPLQYRLAAELGLQRDPRQVMVEAPIVEYWELQKEDVERPDLRLYASFSKVHRIADPDARAWVKDSAYTKLIPDSSVRRRHFERSKAAYFRTTRPAVPKDGLTSNPRAFSVFGDTCMDRSKAGPPTPTNADLGPGVMVRRFMKDGRRYIFFEVLWSPLSEKRKTENLAYDYLSADGARRGSELTATRERALANALIKESVLNGGIPDAVFYAGDGKVGIRQVVRSAICFAILYRPDGDGMTSFCRARLTQGQMGGAPHVVFISESLGSRVLLDSISEMTFSLFPKPAAKWWDEGAPPIDLLAQSPFFMFANQLPMFEIASNDYQANRYDKLFVVGQRLNGPVGPGTPRTARACISAAGVGYGQLAATEAFARDLRRFRDGEAPDTVLAGAPARRAAFDRHLDEAQLCFDAAMANSGAQPDEGQSLIDYYMVDRVISEKLRNPGPAGLDLYLQYRALRVLDEKKEGLAAKDPAVLDEVRARLKTQALSVYAFSDANDILTWEVSDAFKRKFAMVDLVNVQQRIANPVLPVPGRAGLLVNPEHAHLNYRFSDKTIRVVACILTQSPTAPCPIDRSPLDRD